MIVLYSILDSIAKGTSCSHSFSHGAALHHLTFSRMIFTLVYFIAERCLSIIIIMCKLQKHSGNDYLMLYSKRPKYFHELNGVTFYGERGLNGR